MSVALIRCDWMLSQCWIAVRDSRYGVCLDGVCVPGLQVHGCDCGEWWGGTKAEYCFDADVISGMMQVGAFENYSLKMTPW